ncbi:hypothetical protein [Sphingomonas sp. 3-13AW]|uniref:hypothetical protein n=1 Tax=Sphingomonas sp. 3-13AW TaxID=3050450 RepID=UPI003BB7CAAE
MEESAPKIVLVDGCDCPVCGATEVVDNTLPVREWRINVRAHKVYIDGLSWSECLLCKASDGDGWFAHDDEGNVVVNPSRIPAIEARGETVERVQR